VHAQSTNASIKEDLQYTLKSAKLDPSVRNAQLKFSILGLI
jgi:hypothetical protein